MTTAHDLVFPAQVDVRVRQADLGRAGTASTIGMARWLEDARIRLRLHRFERLAAADGVDPFQIILVHQRIERLGSVGPTGARVEVHTGVRRVGRSSFTFEQAAVADGNRVANGHATVVLVGAHGPLRLPEELIADLAELQLPQSSGPSAARPDAERLRPDRYPYHAALRARIGDVDSNQHVNYMALTTWYDEAVAAFTAHVSAAAGSDAVPDLPPWSYGVHYLGEVTYPGSYEIGVAVRSVDTESVNYELSVFSEDGGECLGVAEAVGPRGELTAESLTAGTG